MLGSKLGFAARDESDEKLSSFFSVNNYLNIDGVCDDASKSAAFTFLACDKKVFDWVGMIHFFTFGNENVFGLKSCTGIETMTDAIKIEALERML